MNKIALELVEARRSSTSLGRKVVATIDTLWVYGAHYGI